MRCIDRSVKNLQLEMLMKIRLSNAAFSILKSVIPQPETLSILRCITHLGNVHEMRVVKFGFTNVKFNKVCKGCRDFEFYGDKLGDIENS